MKDVRGSGVSAIRTAVLWKYGLQFNSKGRKNSRDILAWKNSKEVGENHTRLFSDEGELDSLTKLVFPSIMDDEKSEESYADYYIYTAAVSDIILNPNHPTLEVNRKPLELRLRRFRVFIEFILQFKKIKFINQN